MNQTQFHEQLSKMPPLRHSTQPEGDPFVLDNSDALNWVLALPGLKQWIWWRAVSTGRIRYDKETKCWSGWTPPVVEKPEKLAGPVGRPARYTDDEILGLVANHSPDEEDAKSVRELKACGFAGGVGTLHTILVRLRDAGKVRSSDRGFWLASPAREEEV